jgi:hypothetical protein
VNQKLRAALDREWAAALEARTRGDFSNAFAHLERAHILSQRFTGAHVRTHLLMFGLGWRRRDQRELLGQVSRAIAAAVFSRIWIPEGNTGGANVSAFRSMPVPDELREILGLPSSDIV